MDAGFKLLETKFQKNFIECCDGFFERFFHHIKKQASLGIPTVPSYNKKFLVAYYERDLGIYLSCGFLNKSHQFSMFASSLKLKDIKILTFSENHSTSEHQHSY